MVGPLDESATASAGAVARAVADRQVSALEMVDAAIARIEDRDEAINAVVARDFDRVREQAGSVGRAVSRGERPPLMGAPMTVKEVFHISGLPTTFGLETARDYRPTVGAVAMARLKAAGAVILGKSNAATGFTEFQNDNPVYERTRNPHNLEHTRGGRDRIPFSTDWPFENVDHAANWFDTAAISDAYRIKVGLANARALFKLD
jgi:amidase